MKADLYCRGNGIFLSGPTIENCLHPLHPFTRLTEARAKPPNWDFRDRYDLVTADILLRYSGRHSWNGLANLWQTGLPLDFFDAENNPRECPDHGQYSGLIREPENPTWFRIDAKLSCGACRRVPLSNLLPRFEALSATPKSTTISLVAPCSGAASTALAQGLEQRMSRANQPKTVRSPNQERPLSLDGVNRPSCPYAAVR